MSKSACAGAVPQNGSVQTALEMMKQYLDGSYEPLRFSLDMELFLCNQYDAMLTENAALTEFLNENLPEICAGFERDMFGSELAALRSSVAKVYQKALTCL